MSEYFEISRSARQGCPISPLLYIIQCEPLACTIRANQNIQGMQLPNGKSVKINLFADDTQFFNKNEESINKCFETIVIYIYISSPLSQENYSHSANKAVLFEPTQCLNELSNIANKPKEYIISHILDITRNSTENLKALRITFSNACCEKHDFPCKEGTLIKRLEARSTSAPRKVKLARDCFVLLRALLGEYAEDLKEVVGRRTKKQECISQSNTTIEHTYSDVFEEKLITMQRTIISIQRKQEEYESTTDKKLNEILKEKSKAQDRASHFRDQLKTAETNLKDTKEYWEQRYSDLDKVMVEMRKDNFSLKRVNDENDDLITTLRNDLATLIVGVSKMRDDLKLTKEKISDCELIAKRVDDQKMNGIASIRTAMKVMSTDMKRNDTDVATLTSEIDGLKRDLNRQSDALKKHNKKKKEVTSVPQVPTHNRFAVLGDPNEQTDIHATPTDKPEGATIPVVVTARHDNEDNKREPILKKPGDTGYQDDVALPVLHSGQNVLPDNMSTACEPV